MKSFPSVLVLALSLASISSAFQVPEVGPRNAQCRSPTTILGHHAESADEHVMSRAKWMQRAATATATMVMAPLGASAANDDPALKGTKKDPAFEACLSQCMYDCTKPKGSEQKSRAQCLPECKANCAKTKAQLMIGTPLN